MKEYLEQLPILIVLILFMSVAVLGIITIIDFIFSLFYA